MKRILPLILCLLCAPLAGCPSQNTAAALVGIAGSAIASLETIEGNTAAAAKIQVDFAAAQTAVLNWKSGTPTQDVAQALQIVEIDLNLLPISAQDQAYVTLAIGTVDSILALFPSTTSAPAFSDAHTVKLAVVPKTAEQFKAQWNAIGGIAPPLK